MTDDQWNVIVEYVRAELEKHKEFSIPHTAFERMFGLNGPYYQEMVSRARENCPGFEFESPYKTPTKEPGDHIWFRLPE